MSGRNKPRLLLHVGSHKTGTTSVQEALATCRPWLETQGVYYPNPRPFFFQKTDAHHDLAHALAGDNPRQTVGAKRFLKHLVEASSRFDRIVLSAEPFYRHTLGVMHHAAPDDLHFALAGGRRRYVERMAEYFDAFDVEILLFFRRTDGFAESLYKSAVVSTDYFGGIGEFIHNNSIKFAYKYQVDTFREFFPKTRVLSYEQSLSAGIVETFFKVIGLETPPTSGTIHLRSSLTDKATLWIDRCKREGTPEKADVARRWHFAMQPVAAPLFQADTKTSLWESARERNAFLQQYLDDEFADLFPSPGDAVPAQAILTDQEFKVASDAFSRWRHENAEYLAKREELRIPPYIICDLNLDATSWPINVVQSEQPLGAGPEGKIVAAICCATRERPKMLAALLDSWSNLDIPDDLHPVFIVVENDELAACEDIVLSAQTGLAAGELLYVVEPEVGIPHARNSAVRAALEKGAQYILFVDDDETVSPDWLQELYKAHKLSGAKLIGGPVRANFAFPPPNRYRKHLQDAIRSRYERVENKALRRLHKGRGNKTAILTNNWFADATLFTENRLSFDRSLRFTGGSDTKFFRDAVAAGVRTRWAPQAIVFETVPPERVSFGYQIKRGAAQSKTSIRAKIRNKGRVRILPGLIVSVAVRGVGAGLLIVSLPFSRGATSVSLARSLGWIAGRVTGFFGSRSNLYRETTGS